MRIRPPAAGVLCALLALALAACGSTSTLGYAASRSLDDACPRDVVSDAGFRDTSTSVHRRAIDCLAHWDITEGRTATRYAPAELVDRAQTAAFLARAIVRTSGTVPEPTRDHFDDDDASVHEPSINALAEAGVIAGRGPGRYEPLAPLTRAQMAALVVRAFDLRAEQAGQEPLPAGPDAFPDDGDSPLEPDIDRAAAAGFVEGYPDGTYRPNASVARDAMASFVARWLDLAVARGMGEVPPPQARTATVAATGDIACRPGATASSTACAHRLTADAVDSFDPHAVLLLGDIQYEDGSVAEFTGEGGWTGTWSRFLDRSYPVAGNHEWATPGAEGYRHVFDGRTGGRWWYSFDLAGWHVVALDSNCDKVGGCGEGSAQHDWLLQDLVANDGRPTLLFWHHPRWSTGMHGGYSRVDDFWKTATGDSDVQLVLTSHDHTYERFPPLDAAGARSDTGVRSFVVGSGGRSHHCDRAQGPASEVFDCTSFGVLRLDLRPDGYDWRFVAATGSQADQGSSGLRP